MTTGIQKSIQVALQKRLESVTNVPTICWPNDKEQDISNASVYLRPTLFFSDTLKDTLNGKDRYSGFYQIDIYTLLDKTESKLVQWLDTISDHFLAQNLLTQDSIVVIIDTPLRGGGKRQDQWWWGYIQINFNCFA